MLDKIDGNLLQWLRGFYFVVQLGGVTRAAEHMGLKQSTVSQQIKNLEQSLKVTLFIRRSKSLEITSAGRLLYSKIIPLFEHVRTVIDAVGRKEGELKGLIRLATTHAIAEFFLTKPLKAFLQAHSEVQFIITGGGYGLITEAVANGSVDFGIVSLGDFADHLVYEPVFGSRLVAISPPGNPFGLPPYPTLDDIAKVPFISFPPRGTVDTAVKSVLQSRGLSLKTVISANTFYLLLEYVRAGLGITMLDIFTVHDSLDRYDIFEIADNLPDRQYVFLWRQNKRFADQVTAFIDSIRENPPPGGCTRTPRLACSLRPTP